MVSTLLTPSGTMLLVRPRRRPLLLLLPLVLATFTRLPLREVHSDLYGERGALMGGIHGMFLAQYEVLRERGHTPSEAFNETVEEATQSLPLDR